MKKLTTNLVTRIKNQAQSGPSLQLATVPFIKFGHENQIAARLNKLRFQGEADIDKTLVILAFVNRSGSSLLGEYLASLSGFSGFRETLNSKFVLKNCDINRIDSFPDFIRHIATRAGGHSFGVKASAHQIRMLAKWNILGMFNNVRTVHIMRQDVIAQAVSLWIAKHTEEWSSRDRAKISESDIPYNFGRIGSICADIEQKNSEIRLALSALNLPSHGLQYERLISEPEFEMQRLGQFLGADLSAWTPPANPRHEKQKSHVKEDFIRRFRNDTFQNWSP